MSLADGFPSPHLASHLWLTLGLGLECALLSLSSYFQTRSLSGLTDLVLFSTHSHSHTPKPSKLPEVRYLNSKGRQYKTNKITLGTLTDYRMQEMGKKVTCLRTLENLCCLLQIHYAKQLKKTCYCY